MGRNILGNPEQLKQFRSEDAAAFTARFYHPNNMVFFVLGNLSFKKVVLMAKTSGGYTGNTGALWSYSAAPLCTRASCSA